MNFDKLMPSKCYWLVTELSVGEAINRIAESISMDRKISAYEFRDPLKRQYTGKITNNIFSIRQVIVQRRNPSAPLITGVISNLNDKTRINIKMEVRPIAKAFIFLAFGALSFACIIILLAGLLNIRRVAHDGFSPFLSIPFFVLFFGWYLLFASFKIESDNSRYYLIKLLEGQEERI